MYPTSRQFNVIDGGGDVPAAPKIKVSQATVDAVKNDGRGNMGQAAADKVRYGSPGYDGSTFSPNAPVSAEYKEATKRVYPNATAKSPAAASGATNPNQPGPKSQNPKSPGPSNLPPSKSPKNEENKKITPPKIKVSQATIDAIKKAGKEKSIGALKYKGVSAEYKEGVRRLYQSPAKPKAKAPKGGGGSGGGRASSAVM
jgi:hypothetical protein